MGGASVGATRLPEPNRLFVSGGEPDRTSVTCSATDTRFAGTRWKDPRRGGDLFGDFPRPSSIDTPEDRRRSAVRRRPDQSPWEEALATSEAVGEGESPLEGTKAQGRIEPHPLLAAKEATDFRGVYCPGGERGGIGR
jgi:hypothetical protein